MIKIYPDGTIQTRLYDFVIKYNEGEKFVTEGHRAPEQMDIEAYVLQLQHGKTDNIERKERENKSRAVQMVYDYAKCNDFRWFITLTINPDICDSLDYKKTIAELQKFRKYLTKQGLKYLIVPEQHKSGRWHFHGLVSDGLKVVQAFNPEGKEIKGVFHVKDYKLGYTTATEIKDKKRTNTYITKYISKDLNVPKGYKRYWCSVGLHLPKVKVDYIKPNSNEFIEAINSSRFYKRVKGNYGTLHICEK